MTRLKGQLRHPWKHAVLTNIVAENHHMDPQPLSVSNTTQQVEPLPGGPGVWDIVVPFETKAVRYAFRSPWQTNDVAGKAGAHGLASEVAWLEAVAFSQGGPSSWQSGGYFGAFARPTGSSVLSHEVFDATGKIAMTDAYLYQTGASTKVFRTTWTNYGSSYLTLSAVGELHLLG